MTPSKPRVNGIVDPPTRQRRQWYSRRTEERGLNPVLAEIHDGGGDVETVHHLDGRGYMVLYSTPSDGSQARA